MNKILVFIPILIIALVLVAIILFFYTHSVSGKIIDLASGEPLPNVRVKIDGLADVTDQNGLFQIKNIKIYQKKDLEIDVPEGYEQLGLLSLDYRWRSITKDIALEPTLMTMVDRINTALRNFDYGYLWDYMHPDDQQYWESKENYVRTFQGLLEIRGTIEYQLEIEEAGIKRLEPWKHRVTRKEYTGVMEVPIVEEIFYGGKKESIITLWHYQKIDGIWRYFTDNDKEELKRYIEEYEIYKKLIEQPVITSALTADIQVNDSDTPPKISYNSIFAVTWVSAGTYTCAGFGHHIPLVDPVADLSLWTDLINLPASGEVRLYARHQNWGYVNPIKIGIQCMNFSGQQVSDEISIQVIRSPTD